MSRYLDPTLDIVFKLLLGGPETRDCLISLLMAVLKPSSPITEVEVLNPGVAQDAVGDKGIVLDLLVKLGDGTLVDVEMQVDRRPGFRKRALFYWAKAFASQLAKGQLYTQLRPTVFVVFLSYKELEAQRLHSVFRVLETHDHEQFSDELSLHLIELPKLDTMNQDEIGRETKLANWAKFFTSKSDEEFEQAAQGDEMIEKVTDYLERLSAKADVRLLAERREMAHMAYHMEMVEARIEGEAKGRAEGEAKGRAEGEAKGRAEGEAKGRADERRTLLLRLLQSRGIELTSIQRSSIDLCSDTTMLEQWFDQALTAQTVEDLNL